MFVIINNHITITDILGKIVDRKIIKEGVLNAQFNLVNKGIYFVNITNMNSGLQKIDKLINN